MKRRLFDSYECDKCQEIQYHYDCIKLFKLMIYNNDSISIETTIMCTDIHIYYDDTDNKCISKIRFINGPLSTKYTAYNPSRLYIDEDNGAIIVKYERRGK